MKFKESKLAHKYCQGLGVEIGGAAHNPFNIPGCLHLAHSKRVEFWRKSEIELCGQYIEPDMYGSAENIPVDNEKLNYVISSHVIEHVPNPIKAFLEWDRIVKRNGIIFMIFPKRDADPNDAKREVSTLQEFIKQYKNPKHLTDENGHIWIFTLESMIELIEYCNKNLSLNWELVESQETDDKVGNGHTVVYRKK